jgi:NodT family efflux transporter outer membrane factor (OMF) lipoprotein
MIATVALTLTACAAGPDYVRPQAAVPAQLKEAQGWKPAQPADAVPRGAWWEVFNDADLDALMPQAAAANQSLAAAQARYRQATATSAQARAALLPTLGASASATRGRSSASTPTGTTDAVQLSTNWELDLWGRVRRNVESGSASAEASAADLAAAQLSVQAAIAQNYFALRVADAQQSLFAESVAAQEKSLQLTRNRYAAGVVTRADVAQAETLWLSTRSQAIDLGIQRAQLEHGIAVLLGKAPAEFSIAPLTNATDALASKSIAHPDLLPSELLQRRPDVAGAERRVAAANAQIGVAQAAFFPSLAVSATGGFRGPGLADLFSLPNRFWSLGPALAQTLFDGGARSASRDLAIARYDETVADYRQTVLTALAELEDNLAALRWLASEAEVQVAAVRAAQESLRLAINQYQAGTVSYINVASAQATELAARRSALDIASRRETATIGLIKALGGGWQE